MLTQEQIMLIVTAAALLLAVVSLVLGIRANLKYGRLYRQYDYFMRGRNAENLEGYFVEQQARVERLEEEDEKNKEMIRVINRNIRASFQKVGIIHYNAFGGMGGNLSFALAMLDYTNSGYVINSVHAREGCFLYIKEVDAGTTTVELGSEERLALEQALGYRDKE